jgi:hypothetical protein
MPSIASLLPKIRTDFPLFSFVSADEFRWLPHKNTIFYDPTSSETGFLLHELAHAILDHATFTRDIRLIEMERDAWEYAKTTLGDRYGLAINETVIEDSLDTYRDWLHARSTCPHCSATGLQTQQTTYRCVACHHTWRVNDSRSCALRRYSLSPQT